MLSTRSLLQEKFHSDILDTISSYLYMKISIASEGPKGSGKNSLSFPFVTASSAFFYGKRNQLVDVELSKYGWPEARTDDR